MLILTIILAIIVLIEIKFNLFLLNKLNKSLLEIELLMQIVEGRFHL